MVLGNQKDASLKIRFDILKQSSKWRLLLRWRLLLPGLILAVGLIATLMGFRITRVTEGLEAAGPWAPLMFVFIGVAAMSLMTPKTMVSLAAGALFGTTAGCVVMLFTAVSAAAVNYSIGRYWIAPEKSITEPSRDPPLTGHDGSWLRSIKQLASEAGFGLHLLIRLSPIPTTIISYSMGAARARFRPYVMAAAVAVIPQWLYVHTAALASETGQPVQTRWATSILSLSVAVLVSIALPQIAIRRLREIRPASESTE